MMQHVNQITILGLTCASLAATAADPKLAEKALAVFNGRCVQCHGQNGTRSGGIGYIDDLRQLVERKKVIPGNPEGSRIIKRMRSADDPMPPTEDLDGKPLGRLDKGEIDAVVAWIAAGAEGGAAAASRAPTELESMQLVASDLRKVYVENPEKARFTRYFTLHHLVDESEADLDTVRDAIGKLVNSLSWKERIVLPTAVDAAKRLYRIDLRDYGWTETTWNRLMLTQQALIDRSSLSSGALAEALRDQFRLTLTRYPVAKADWFVFQAARPPLYYDILQMPRNESELRSVLKVKDESARRAGFAQSGVALHNRIIERKDSAYGAYWRSYDFLSDGTAAKNIARSPIGPGASAFEFKHDAGEVIFNLPNGLQGYLLVDAAGNIAEKAATEVVQDPRRADKVIINGVSCMSCHSNGLLTKEDEIRRIVTAPQARFPGEVKDTVQTLHGDPEFLNKMEGDSNRYRAAIAKAGSAAGGSSAVVKTWEKFESAVYGVNRIAAELGLDTQYLRDQLNFASPKLNEALAGADKTGIARSTFERNLKTVIEEFSLGALFKPGIEHPPSPTNCQAQRPYATTIGFIGPCTNLSSMPEGNLRGFNFAGADLRGVVFGDADIRSADFSRAQLPYVSFKGRDLSGTKFVDADLRAALFDEKSTFDARTDFSGADLRTAEFRGVDMRPAVWKGAKLAKISVTEQTKHSFGNEEAIELGLIQRTPGACERETERFRSAGGGCWDANASIVWSLPGKGVGHWLDAKYRCTSLRQGGMSDWRLPTRSELETLAKGEGDRSVLPFRIDVSYWSTQLFAHWSTPRPIAGFVISAVKVRPSDAAASRSEACVSDPKDPGYQCHYLNIKNGSDLGDRDSPPSNDAAVLATGEFPYGVDKWRLYHSYGGMPTPGGESVCVRKHRE